MARKDHQQEGKVTLCCLISARHISSKYPRTLQDLLPNFEAAEQSCRAGVEVSPCELWQTRQGWAVPAGSAGDGRGFLFPPPPNPRAWIPGMHFQFEPAFPPLPFFLFMTETPTSHPTELLQPGLAPAALSNGNKHRVACEYRLLEKVPGLH